MNDKYITLKSGTIIKNDITAMFPYASNTYIVVFSGGQSVYIDTEDYNELRAHLIYSHI